MSAVAEPFPDELARLKKLKTDAGRWKVILEWYQGHATREELNRRALLATAIREAGLWPST